MVEHRHLMVKLWLKQPYPAIKQVYMLQVCIPVPASGTVWDARNVLEGKAASGEKGWGT